MLNLIDSEIRSGLPQLLKSPHLGYTPSGLIELGLLPSEAVTGGRVSLDAVVRVNDGDVDSNLATKEIAVTPTNDGPIVTSGGTLSYTENDGPVAVDDAITATDPESTQFAGATVAISSGFSPSKGRRPDRHWYATTPRL